MEAGATFNWQEADMCVLNKLHMYRPNNHCEFDILSTVCRGHFHQQSVSKLNKI